MRTSADLFLEYKRCPERTVLTRLLERHRDGVYAVCLRVLRHAQDAEDACQDVLLKVSRQLDAIEEPGSFAGWLYRTALHTSLDFRRRRERHRVRMARAVLGPGEPAASSPDLEALQRGLAGLDESSRDLVVEHYLARRPLRELAQERGCSSVAVWKRIRNARERLRESIGSAAMLALTGGGKVSMSAGLLTGKAILALAVAMPLVLLGVIGAVLSIRPAEPLPSIAPVRTARMQTPAPVMPTKPAAAQDPPMAVPAAPARKTIAAAERKPYPFKLDPASSNPAARTWAAIRSSRVTLDGEMSLQGIAQEIQRKLGILVRVSPAHESDQVSFKVQDVVVDGCLRLLLQPRQMDYEIRPDGTVYCGPKAEIAGGYEQIGRRLQTDEYVLAGVRSDLDAGWNGVSASDSRTRTVDVLGSKTVVLSQGTTTWNQEIERVKAATGLTVMVDLPLSAGPNGSVIQTQTSKPFLQAVEEQPVATVVERCARDLGLVPCVLENGIVYLTTRNKADEITREAEETNAAALTFMASLSKPAPGSGPMLVSDFLDAIMQGLPVLPTEEVWNSGATVHVAAGQSIREGLDQLKAQGIRWAVRDGKIYLLK